VWKVVLRAKHSAPDVRDIPTENLSPIVSPRDFETASLYMAISAVMNAAPPTRWVQIFIVSICKQPQSRNEPLYEYVGIA